MRQYPVNLALESKPCAVIGGGEVAARKVNGLLEAGAEVTIITPVACDAIEKSARRGEVKIVRRKYRKGDLKGMKLALVATDDSDLNCRVAAEARSLNVPVNVADAPDECDFTLPALLRRGDVTIAIGTGGSSPALARALKDLIGKVIGPEYGELARILGKLRKRFVERGENLAGRRELFESLIASELKECLNRRDYAAARKIIADLAGEDMGISLEDGQ